MGDGWRVVDVDDLEEIPWRREGPTWRPLREALDTRIVGISAYTARRAGETVIEEHAESTDGRGHEEVYTVLRGAAEFSLDGEAIELRPGELVRVAPHVSRRARALEDDTVVLILGGEATFEPSSSEWIERARAALADEPERALAIVEDLRRRSPGSPGVPIAEALLAQADGDEPRAVAILSALLREHPELAAPLREDPDLAPLLPPWAGRRRASAARSSRTPAGTRRDPAAALLVRRADRDDLAALLGLLSQLHEDGPALELDARAEQTFERMLATPGRVVLVCELAGTAVGTVDLLVVENLTHGGRPWATIENLLVDRAHRRLGIGGALLGAAAGIAVEAGAYKLQLVSRERRGAAHALYDSSGFDAPVRGFRRYLDE